MTIDFVEFVKVVLSNPVALITVILILAVILINGWTDAPNAIATCVSTKAISRATRLSWRPCSTSSAFS